MEIFSRLQVFLMLTTVSLSLSAQIYKAERLRRAADVTGIQVVSEVLLPDTTFALIAKDGRTISLRTNSMGEIDHIGIPLFHEMMRILQPSPVYDFLEYAVLNWRYKITPNQLYLSKLIFKMGSWESLLKENLKTCDCRIENRGDKFYILTWKREDKDVVVIGIPIEYELLNNDTRRNMERELVNNLKACVSPVRKRNTVVVSEEELSVYGTEGLFVLPGKSYMIDLLNQNVYYRLSSVYETVDTVIYDKPVTMSMETVQPELVIAPEFPAETFANLMMCDDIRIPDVYMELDFHLSDYHRQHITMPLSQLKSFFRQQGCQQYFSFSGVQNGLARGVIIVSNLSKGYNHLFSVHIPEVQLMAATPSVQADVYLYIPPISKEKLFGIAPTKKSNANFKLP